MKKGKNYYKKNTLIIFSSLIFTFLLLTISANALGVSHKIEEISSLNETIRQQVCETFETYSVSACNQCYNSFCINQPTQNYPLAEKFGHNAEEIEGLSKMIHEAICNSTKNQLCFATLCSTPFQEENSPSQTGHNALQITGLSQYVNLTVNSLVEKISCEKKCVQYYEASYEDAKFKKGIRAATCIPCNTKEGTRIFIPEICYSKEGCDIVQRIFSNGKYNAVNFHVERTTNFKINKTTRIWSFGTNTGINGNYIEEEMFEDGKYKQEIVEGGDSDDKSAYYNRPDDDKTAIYGSDKSSTYFQDIFICPVGKTLHDGWT